MKTKSSIQKNIRPIRALLSVAAAALVAASAVPASASQAYGTVNNFDVVNDTGSQTHGFEIELDDIHSTDITYTYDYNHYGKPKITEFTSFDAAGTHTNVMVDYQAVWINTAWSAYTAVPTNTIPPTMGHQFTNPNLNFGGEHFGVGYTKNPSKVVYFWMADGGAHTLLRSGQVYVSTPVFNYSPAVFVAQQQVQPAVVAPVIPAPILPMNYVCPNPEFSDAVWCKVITTTSHTNSPININDLMTPDTNNPAAKDWRNGQTNVEVETEWQLLQIDYLSSDYNPTNGLGGNNAKLAGLNRGLTNSDDVVTYRYEYYAYAGPYADWDTHEAMCQMPAADGIHGTGSYVDANSITQNLATVVVVGKFLGAQMSAGAAAPPVGLIDHVPDGQYGVTYTPRTVIITGTTNFTTSYTGTLPPGMAFDTGKAVLYGTPFTNGIFTITVTATTSNNPPVTKTYPFWIAASGQVLPPHSTVDVGVLNTNGGTASGNGVFTNGTRATVTAMPMSGYAFTGWLEDGAVVSKSVSYAFTNIINRSLTATFLHQPKLIEDHAVPTQRHLRWPTNDTGYVLEEINSLGSTNWATSTNGVSVNGTNYQINLASPVGMKFYRLRHP
jgi:hypothetical protein